MPTPSLTSVCVYCGSRFGTDPRYREAAEAVGKALAEEGIRLVFGGGTMGLMGASASAARDHGGKVLGIIPQFLMDQEGLLDGIEHEIVETMHERKIKMFEASDAFCVLPGGIGTLEEMVEVLSWSSLALHQKPIVLINVAGYWDPFCQLIEHVCDGGFAYPGLRKTLVIIDEPARLITAVRENLGPSIERV